VVGSRSSARPWTTWSSGPVGKLRAGLDHASRMGRDHSNETDGDARG
jgi:hypothetical protein